MCLNNLFCGNETLMWVILLVIVALGCNDCSR